VRALLEGAILILVAAGLLVGLGLMPDLYFRSGTAERRVMLGLASAAWVLQWYGVWKLTTRDPHALRGFRWQQKGQIVRGTVTASALFPVWFAAIDERSPFRALTWILGPTLIVSFLCGLVGTCAFWLRIRQYAVRVPSTTLSTVAGALAALATVLGLLLSGSGSLGHNGNSLTVLLEWPSVPLVGVFVAVEWAPRLMEFPRAFGLIDLLFLIPVASCASVALLAYQLARALRAASANGSAHPPVQQYNRPNA
jgi:hypothetical protein